MLHFLLAALGKLEKPFLNGFLSLCVQLLRIQDFIFKSSMSTCCSHTGLAHMTVNIICEEPGSKYGIYGLWHLLNSAMVEQEQSKTIHKLMSLTIFQ